MNIKRYINLVGKIGLIVALLYPLVSNNLFYYVYYAFIFLIGIQVVHWGNYFYSRFAKSLEPQREAIKAVAKLAEMTVNYSKDKKERDDNVGYS